MARKPHSPRTRSVRRPAFETLEGRTLMAATVFGVAASTPSPSSVVLSDGGFESPSVGSGGYYSFAYRPVGSPWSFTGNAGVSGNGSGFTGLGTAPEGAQVGFLQVTGAFTQTVPGLAAGTYHITFDAAQRGGSGQDFRVLVDGAPVGTFTPSGRSYAEYATAAFTVASGPHTVGFEGLDTAGGDNTAFIDDVRLVPEPTPTPAPGLADGGFESPSVGSGGYYSFQYQPAGSPWSFALNAGVAGNGSGFTGLAVAPEGTQVGFLQAAGSITQTVTGMAAGSYQVAFDAAQRGSSAQDFRVLVDGIVVGTFTPAGAAYATYTTAAFAVPAGTHTVKFEGLDTAGGDNTAFIDDVRLVPTPDPAPVARPGAAATAEGVALAAAAPGVLANASDPDGDRLTAALVSPPAHGALALSPDGSYSYTPAPGFAGTDSFTYAAADPAGAASVPATVTITVAADPRRILESAARAEAAAYITAQEAIDAAAHPTDMVEHDEHEAVLDLVPFGAATATAILNGNWSDPDTWLGRAVPGPGARVWIMPGRTVTVDTVLTDPVFTVRVTGTLRFAPDRDTQLKADTVVVDPSGSFIMGTKDAPIDPAHVARMVFTGRGPIDLTWDPGQYSRGLISLGAAEIYGAAVTPWLALARPPMAGDTTLEVSAAPAGWKPGDTLALEGTHYTDKGTETESERLVIASIEGRTVRLASPVRFDHDVPTPASLAAKFGQAPPGAALTVEVADLTRNARFESEDPDVLGDRGHVMFMHSANVAVVDAGFYGLGRTDKSVPLSDDNPRGRYALHFHRTGTAGTPIVVDGVVVDGSPGWGVVNHSSNVDVTNSVVYGAAGSAFVAEAGDERGSFRGDLALNSYGSPNDTVYNARNAINDYGYAGHGFWLQSPTVAMVGNVVSGAASIGIVYYPVAYEDGSTNVAPVTIAECRDNTVVASLCGMDIYASTPTGAPDRVEGLTAWGLHYDAFGLSYSRDVELVGCRFIDDHGGTAAVNIDSGPLVSYTDCYVVGYALGLDAGYGGRNTITGGYLDNGVDVRVVKNNNYWDAFMGVREVVISGVHFAGGGIVMDGTVPDVADVPEFWIRYAPERIEWDGRQLYYAEQAAAQALASPFPGLDGKTNAESLASFGLAYAGAVTPAGSAAVAGLSGGLAGPSTAAGAGPLFLDASWTDGQGRIVQVMDDTIAGVRIAAYLAPGDLTPGWNVIWGVDAAGVRRPAFRYVPPPAV